VIGLENAGLPIPIGKLLEGRGTSKPNRTRSKVSCVGADGKSRGSHAKLFQQLDLPPVMSYALSVLSLIYCPRSSTTVDSRLLEYVSSIEVMNQYNWCEFVLNYLFWR
jgi:hypothetical protein